MHKLNEQISNVSTFMYIKCFLWWDWTNVTKEILGQNDLEWPGSGGSVVEIRTTTTKKWSVYVVSHHYCIPSCLHLHFHKKKSGFISPYRSRKRIPDPNYNLMQGSQMPTRQTRERRRRNYEHIQTHVLRGMKIYHINLKGKMCLDHLVSDLIYPYVSIRCHVFKAQNSKTVRWVFWMQWVCSTDYFF